MLPKNYNDDLRQDFTVAEQPTLTYRLNFDGTPTSGKINGLEAMKQAIFLALHTERFTHAIFSWNYGAELRALYGEGMTPYLQARLQQTIEDALLQDDRILRVADFTFTARPHGAVLLTFTVFTTQGDVPTEFEWKGGGAA